MREADEIAMEWEERAVDEIASEGGNEGGEREETRLRAADKGQSSGRQECAADKRQRAADKRQDWEWQTRVSQRSRKCGGEGRSE